MEQYFDFSEEYDSMLNQGLKYSGEDKFYFLKNRVDDLIKKLPVKNSILKVLDFGCGIGDTSNYLKKCLPHAEVYGTDTSLNAIEYAKKRFPDIHFYLINELQETNFDLCYCNGVFHHIIPSQRAEVINFIYSKLHQGGIFSLFDNNPLNPGTRIVMSKIPFDRDAIIISSKKAGKLLEKDKQFKILEKRFLFYFPKKLRFLRFIEKYLIHVPFGAQYCVLAQKM